MKRLYVLIGKSLNPIYGCVQGGHAVAQYMLEHKDWKNEYLIYLSADVEREKEKLSLLGKDFSIFREPDLNNKTTAIAVVDDGSLFKKLNLVSFGS